MFKLSTDAKFAESIDINDPINAIPREIAEAGQVALAQQIDGFVRAAIRKAIPDEIVALYADDGKTLPELDLSVEILTYRKQRITVSFRGKVLGQATFETRLVDFVGSQMIIHEVKDLKL